MSAPAPRPSAQVPRRLLGAVLSVLVPGAGHVVIGYPRVGWIVGGLSLALGGVIVMSARACAITPFLLFGAVYIFGTVASVLSVLGLPPGADIGRGARGLWPVLVLFVLFRGAAYAVQTWALEADLAPDGAMRPAIEKGDVVLAALGRFEPRAGDVVVVEHGGDRHLRRVRAVDEVGVEVVADEPRERGPVPPRVARAQVHARALFVFAAARGSDGRARVWKRLQVAP
jgi:hypothetical protein